jgi:hypothetical protein
MGVREIPLTKGRVAVVDEADFARLSQRKWLIKDNRYAARNRRKDDPEGGRFIYMHREVIGPLASDQVPDHINGDTLDNRRENLRACTQAENLRNRRPHSEGRFPYKGIKVKGGRWTAHLMISGRRIYSKSFPTMEEAARAYDVLAREHHGVFARLNFADQPLSLAVAA